MTDRVKLLWVYGASALFLALNIYLFLHEKFWGLAAPLALLLAILYFFSLDKVMLLITFLTPIAINLKNVDFGVAVSIPTEPMMFIVLILFVIKLFLDGYSDDRVVRHPVTIAIIINLVWIFITCFTSEIPMVSVKFLISRLWFVIPFYFIGILLFKNYKNIKTFQWVYVLPLLIVIFYTLYNHSTFGFDKPHSNMVMKPFYNDHTAYGAVIAMFLPVFFGFTISKEFKRSYRILALITLGIMIVGLIFSYSRAAWISIAVAILVYFIILFRIKFHWLMLAIAGSLAVFFMFRYQLIDKLEKNKQDSSTDFIKHIQSMSNISSDASNLERINRWASALRLFKERPLFGWGPGTYQFVYAPYQRSSEKTIISTNYGDMGNAHSEYIGPLSESGILGMLTFLGIVVTVIITGLRVLRHAKSREVRLLSLLIMLGLVTYYVHGLLNNFLDTDKASVPFWGFTAMLVAMELYHSDKTDLNKEEKGEEMPIKDSRE